MGDIADQDGELAADYGDVDPEPQSAGGDQCYCPMCSFDLSTGDIPLEFLASFGYKDPSELCKFGCGRRPHYSGLFAVMDPQDETKVKEYQCPQCLERWPA